MKKLKIALVHDYLKEYGGAERVLESLHKVYPDATVFTAVYIPAFLGPHKERFKDWKIKTSWLQYVPFKHKLLSPMRLITPFVFKQFDFSEFDVVIVSSTGAFFPNTISKKNAVHICYCHTPPRYLYGYATAREWKKNGFTRAIIGVMNHILRMVDFNASRNVDYYIANSEEVAERIEKFYRRESTVIYPPVEIPQHKRVYKNQKGEEYFLTGGRLARAKHVDVIVKACSELGIPLKVFGKGFAGYGEELQAIAGPTVAFVGEVNDQEKYALMQGAKAFLFASEDEDFGIVPVESMACGTPVIAYRSGGVKETVIDKKTGVFFNKLTVESLQKAINELRKLKINENDCRKQAEKFAEERFMKEIKDFVMEKCL